MKLLTLQPSQPLPRIFNFSDISNCLETLPDALKIAIIEFRSERGYEQPADDISIVLDYFLYDLYSSILLFQ